MHASRFGLIPNSLVCPTSLKDYKCHDQYCTMYNTCHSFVSMLIVFCIALSHSDFLVFFFCRACHNRWTVSGGYRSTYHYPNHHHCHYKKENTQTTYRFTGRKSLPLKEIQYSFSAVRYLSQ